MKGMNSFGDTFVHCQTDSNLFRDCRKSKESANEFAVNKMWHRERGSKGVHWDLKVIAIRVQSNVYCQGYR